jgi:hypothetical protein
MSKSLGTEDGIQPVLNLYCDLMEEIKVRQASILLAASGQLPIHPRLAYEYCYLQLRMICELIALGCLVMHGDIPEVSQKKLKKAYAPGVIISELEKLHPNFYPQPGEQVRAKKDALLEVRNLTDGFLTKADLIDLWSKSGDVLHRGSLKNLDLRLKEGGTFVRIGSWCEQITKLLNHHQIALFNSTSQVWVIMNAVEDGKVHASLMALVGPATSAAGTM